MFLWAALHGLDQLGWLGQRLSCRPRHRSGWFDKDFAASERRLAVVSDGAASDFNIALVHALRQREVQQAVRTIDRRYHFAARIPGTHLVLRKQIIPRDDYLHRGSRRS
jgi:hypothetical protein